MDCHFSVWGVLAFLSLALVVSLTLNVSHYMKKKQESIMPVQLLLPMQLHGYEFAQPTPLPFREKLPLQHRENCTCGWAAKLQKDYEDNGPSCEDYYTEDDPVYGNLRQNILEECCYEQMKSQPQSQVNQLQVEPDSQMCYASLDHSVKRKHRKPRRNKDPSLEEAKSERSSNSGVMSSKVTIYLNSEQLAAEDTGGVEAVHDDPIRLMGLIHTTKGENI